jgi:polar amino acid transport system substrate-binding protein
MALLASDHRPQAVVTVDAMYHRGLYLILLALLGGVLGRCAGAEDAPPLRWGADAEGGAPYIFRDPGNPERNVGFEVDLSVALTRELGRPIEHRQYDFVTLVLGLERGDVDFVMNGFEVTPDRVRRLRFSRPYYLYRLQLVVRAGEQRFDSLESCKTVGGTVGTLGDTAASRLLDQMGITTKAYDSQAEPYRDLELGRVDAVLLDLPIAVYYARPNEKLQFVGPLVGEGVYAIAFRPDQESLAAQFDAALERLAARGELRRIYEQWGIWNDDQLRLFSGGPVVFENVLKDTATQLTFGKYFPLLCASAWVTIKLAVLSMALAMAIGLPVALARLYGATPVRWLAVVYVEFFRGTPVLLLLYLLYYGVPALLKSQFGLVFRPADFTVAILTFGLNYAAYESEIYRAGIGAIPVGQWEAAASLGMSRLTTFRRIIFPQALRLITPPVTNDFVALFKDTSLVSVIAVIELTKQYQLLSKSSMKYMEIGATTAVLYLAMSVPLGWLARALERRWGRGL